MVSLSIKSVTLISCWMIMTTMFNVKGDLSPGLLDFMSVFNGYCDNYKQAMESNGAYDFMQAKFQPVLLPFLQAEPVILCLEAINHRLYRILIMKITASADGKTIYFTPYNFTSDISQYKLEDVTVHDLAKFKPKDYKSDDNCRSLFRETSRGAYSGELTDCRHAFNGIHFKYPTNVDCDSFMFNAHKQSAETRTVISYDLRFSGDRYPVPGAPSDYLSPCQNKKSDK